MDCQKFISVEPSERESYLVLERKLDLLLRAGALLLECLADSNRIDRNLRRIALYMGIDDANVHMHITYTTLMIHLGDGENNITKFRKCISHSVNMAVLSDVSTLSWNALENNYSLDRFEAQLAKIEQKPSFYPLWLKIIGISVADAGFCALFGCDAVAAAIAAIATGLAFFVRHFLLHKNVNVYFSIAIAAFVAVVVSGSTTFFDLSATPFHPVFASVLFLIPGVPMINSIDDMLDGFTIVGFTRGLIALIAVIAIAFGMALGLNLLSLTHYEAELAPQESLIVVALAAAAAATGFAMVFNVPRGTLYLSALGGALAVVTRNLLVYKLGISLPLGSACGALLVGFLTIYVSRLVHTPRHMLSIPTIIPMVPGVLMYNSLIGLLNIQVDTVAQLVPLAETFQSALTALLTILAISLGVAIPNVIGRRFFAAGAERALNRRLRIVERK